MYEMGMKNPYNSRCGLPPESINHITFFFIGDMVKKEAIPQALAKQWDCFFGMDH